MHQILFRLGLRPRPRWGSLQRSPDPLAGFVDRFAAGRRGWAGKEEGKEREGEVDGRKGEVDGREREGPKLLLNQGPSEPCYASVHLVAFSIENGDGKSHTVVFFSRTIWSVIFPFCVFIAPGQPLV